LLFSTPVDLMGFVVTRCANSVHAVYVDQRDRIPVSIKALYDKLCHVEGSRSRALAVCSYSLHAAVKGALRGVHGEEKARTEVSNYFLTNKVGNVYAGMMIALPPETWKIFEQMSWADLAADLLRWVRGANLAKYSKQRHGPKKPKQPCPNAEFQHVSTAKLLEKKR
jgi:hypothetical protein